MAVYSLGYAPIRKRADDGVEYFLINEVDLLIEGAQAKVLKNETALGACNWAKSNPIVRWARVEIKEVAWS